MSMIGNIGGQSGGGILTKSILIVTAPTGSTVTMTKGSVTKAAAEKNGEWWFRNLDNGEWTITATKNTLKATATYSITQFGVYRKEITYFQATINVTYPAGSTCTASNGDTTLRAPDTSGKWTCIVPNAGSWTISSTLGGQSDRKTVSISSDGQTASVELTYFKATIDVTYPAGSICTVSANGATHKAPDTSGRWSCVVNAAATWVVSATDGKVTSSKDVVISTDKQTANVTLVFDVLLSAGYWDGNITKMVARTYEGSGATPVIATKNKIDLTHYRSITFDMSHGGGVDGDGKLFAATTKSPSSKVAEKMVSAPFSSGTKKGQSLDISGLTGSYYLIVQATAYWSGTNTMGFLNVTLRR